jgi:hypothetical protein
MSRFSIISPSASGSTSHRLRDRAAIVNFKRLTGGVR